MGKLNYGQNFPLSSILTVHNNNNGGGGGGCRPHVVGSDTNASWRQPSHHPHPCVGRHGQDPRRSQ